MSGNDYGNISLGDVTPSINVDDVVKALRTEFEKSLVLHPVMVGDLQLSLVKSITGQGGHRYWFICPDCGSRVAKLYVVGDLVACRHCLNIKYRSSRYKNMPEGEIRGPGSE